MNKNQKYIVIPIVLILVFATLFSLYGYPRYKNNAIDKEKTRSDSKIILYNSHSQEEYTSKKTVEQLTEDLEKKIFSKDLSCTYLANTKDVPREDAYESSRNLIKENVIDYNNKVLLDIHIDYFKTPRGVNDGIRIVVGKGNPHFEVNMANAKLLLDKLKTFDNIKSSIYTEKIALFNQDMSSNSILIEIGNSSSSKKDIDSYTNALATSLKNLYSPKN